MTQWSLCGPGRDRGIVSINAPVTVLFLMCTLSWCSYDGRRDIFFNRDEKRTRARGVDVEEKSTSMGVRYLSPTDPDGGGTWMLANQSGIVVCLLNRWHDPSRSGDFRSRGLLVDDLAGVKNLGEVASFFGELDFSSYQPFTLVAFDRDSETGWEWDGSASRPADLVPPMISSSYRFEEVARVRREQYSGMVSDRPAAFEALADFHSGVGVEATAYTPRMCREDAQTWHRSHLVLTDAEIGWNSYVESEWFRTEAEYGRKVLKIDCSIDIRARCSKGGPLGS